MLFRKGRLLTKILLLFSILIVLFTANGIYSIWQWQRIQSHELDLHLREKLTLADTILVNQQDKFEHISLIIKEQIPTFLNMLEYDQVKGLNLQLRYLSQLYEIDLLLLFDEKSLIATSNSTFHGEMPDFVYNAIPFNLDTEGVTLESLPAYLFPSSQPTLQYLCFQAVLPLYYDAGDLAGHLVMLKTLNHNEKFAQYIARLTNAEVAIFNNDQSPVMRSLPLPYTLDEHSEYQDRRFYLLRKPLLDAEQQVLAELIVALDSAPFVAQQRLSILSHLVPFLLILGVSVFLLLFLRGRIFDKLRALIRALQAIKQGHLDIRLQVSGQSGDTDELNEMAANFNTMMERLQNTYQELDNSRSHLSHLNQQLRHEVIERKSIAGALQEAKQEAELANRAKSVFLANMSHEIRTPMNAILGYAHLLLRHPQLDEAQHKALQTIAHSGQHLLELINDILDISKIEAGRMELHIAPFDLRDLLNELAAMFVLRCEEKQLEWRLVLPDKTPMSVMGDARKLRQIVINLLGNAVKFTESGTVCLTVRDFPESHYEFVVRDTGLGIDAHTQAHIFEAFQQGSAGLNKGGTGLGLTIARRQVELMGGRLSLESQPDEGTVFSFRLSLPDADPPMPLRANTETDVMYLAANHHIEALVVDDVAENREVLSQLLSSIGVQVRAAETAEAGLDLLAQQAADIVFMDYRLPNMNGIQATQHIQRLFGSRTPVVMVSASTFDTDHQKFTDAGCAAFIDKPFQPEQIFQCLKTILKVEYEYKTASEVMAIDWTALSLPDALVKQIRESAEFGIVTTLESSAQTLARQGGEAEKFSLQLAQWAKNYQMDKILECLNEHCKK